MKKILIALSVALVLFSFSKPAKPKGRIWVKCYQDQAEALEWMNYILIGFYTNGHVGMVGTLTRSPWNTAWCAYITEGPFEQQ